MDRTNNFIVSSMYQLPFGKNKQFVNSGIGAVVLGGWSLHGVFYHLSGLPFYVSASNSSCNCPNAISTQLANQVKPTVAKGSVPTRLAIAAHGLIRRHSLLSVQPAFGNSSFNYLRGPGATNFDASVFRDFQIWERLSMQFRAEGFNVTNTPHFADPNANVFKRFHSQWKHHRPEWIQPDHDRQLHWASTRCKILPLRGAVHLLSYGK